MGDFLYRFLVAAMLTTISQVADAASGKFVPSMKQIATLERNIVLPEGAGHLRDYARFYAGLVLDGKQVIFVLLRSDLSKRGMEVVDADHLPVVFDGGCSVVHAVYEIESGSFKKIGCNGVA